jgi:hypothetical protein
VNSLRLTISSLVILLLAPAMTGAEEWKFPCAQNEIARYTACRVSEPITIDGRLDEPAWQKAPTSPRFVDIQSGKPAPLDTRAAVLWDDENLYIAFRVEEPFLHAKFTTNNSPVYYDNDIEVFIAGQDAYYEFEVNGFNTTYEVFFICANAYDSGGFSGSPDFSRAHLQPFNGVDFKNHPRGDRLGSFDWHFPGKKSAVSLNGTVNNDQDRDQGWTVELAFPWKGMTALAKADHRSLPPKDGDVWRMDFSRFNAAKETPPTRDPTGWVWSRHGIWDSHIPECFPYIRFSTNDISRSAP